MSESFALLEAREERTSSFALPEPRVAQVFSELATAVGGISLLRELICALAITGKLLPQDSTDEPASHLRRLLRHEKQRLMGAGQIRKERLVDDDEAFDSDLELPRAWELVRLSDVAWPQAGFAFKSSAFNESGHGLPLVRIRDVGSNSPTTFFSGAFRDEFIVHKGDWLISMDGDFRVALWDGPDALLNQRVTRLVFFGERVQPLYICLALQQELRKLQGTKAYTTVDHLSGGQIASRVIPLPPLAEQHRLVARVEELMKLCDALEQNGRLADEQHARLTSTLFDALAASESAHALAENWQRVAKHFDLLLDRPDAIDALEQIILRMAVRGLLVSQDANDESASRLLERISERRVPGTSPARILPAEGPYEIPTSWTWCALDSIADVGTGTTPSRTNAAYFEPAEVPWVNSGETCQPYIAFTAQHVSALALRETSLRIYPPGTLVVAMYGQGKTRGQISELMIAATTNQACAAIVPIEANLHHRRYLKIVFEKSYDELRAEAAGGAQPNLNVGKIRAAVIPLPPLPEQHRIVARVEELRRLCADLRERLTRARETQSRLADALVAEVA